MELCFPPQSVVCWSGEGVFPLIALFKGCKSEKSDILNIIFKDRGAPTMKVSLYNILSQHATENNRL